MTVTVGAVAVDVDVTAVGVVIVMVAPTREGRSTDERRTGPCQGRRSMIW